jgi:hypothetical protein
MTGDKHHDLEYLAFIARKTKQSREAIETRDAATKPRNGNLKIDLEAQRQLGLELIDVGFRHLATKMHPDTGGTTDAMALLIEVRDRLRQALPSP